MSAPHTHARLRGGIEFGGARIQAIVVDERNRVLGCAERPTPAGQAPEVSDALVDAIREAAGYAGTTPGQLAGIGVGSPGTVDIATGMVSDAREIPGWGSGFALGEALRSELSTRVELGSAVRLAAGAEFALGSGRSYISLLAVHWDVCVRGALILNCEEWLGRGGAGEIGHLVISRGGRRCHCGNRGCLDAYAGRAAMEARAYREIRSGRKSLLPRLMRDTGREHFSSAVWATALAQGDALAIELINDAVDALGAGIASAVNLLDLPAVVLGGGLATRLGAPYMQRIREATGKHLFPGHQQPDIHLTRLGELGGPLGAALLIDI